MSFKYDLTKLQDRSQLISFLGLTESIFDNVLAFDPNARTYEYARSGVCVLDLPLFLRHEIPKKNPARGYRVAWEPLLLKYDYKAFARRLSSFFEYALDEFPHPRTFGYIGGRNIRENARDHCGHRHLISVDLKDFFPSIAASRVATCLVSSGVAPIVADLISRFVTIDGALPLGLPTSPTIANAVCLPMDKELHDLAHRHSATFSRYADDISFSGNETLPSKGDIAGCVGHHGFELAVTKTRTSTLGRAHYVTGLSVSDPAQPHVPREKKRRLRLELYYATKYGLDEHLRKIGVEEQEVQQHVNRMDGTVKFISYHEPLLASRLKPAWNKVLQECGHRPSFTPKNQDRAPFFIHIDEAIYRRADESRVLALAMATSQHQAEIDKTTAEVLAQTTSDVWAAGKTSLLVANGLHFNDASEDTRLAYIERIRSMPVQGYVAMASLRDAASYEETYLRLLNAMIKRRLMAAESQYAFLLFERNDNVSQQAIRQSVSKAYDTLARSDNRRPEYYDVRFVKKPTLGMSVPDFLLGALGRYLKSGQEQAGKPLSRDKLLFERIRDKYRLILDVDSRIEYSRRRPIAHW